MTRAMHRDDKAYHGEIGREATAMTRAMHRDDTAYHGEIGREATAREIATVAGD